MPRPNAQTLQKANVIRYPQVAGKFLKVHKSGQDLHILFEGKDLVLKFGDPTCQGDFVWRLFHKHVVARNINGMQAKAEENEAFHGLD